MLNSKDNNLLYEAYASVYNSSEYLEESQHARENPDEYERSPEAREGRRNRSGINDPKTGINSPAFAAFMAQQMGGKKKKKAMKEDVYQIILSYLLDEGYADDAHSAVAIMGNMSEEWRDSIVESLLDTVASGAGSVVGTVQRAAREVPKYVQQKVRNVAGTYEYARQRADANAPSGSTTMSPAKNAGMSGKSSAPRSREFSHGNQGGKPAPTPMKNPGPNFGRG